MMFDLKKFGERTALTEETGQTLTYDQLESKADDLGKKIHRNFAFCLCTNSIDSVTGYVAFLNHDVPVFLLDAGINPGNLLKLIHIYQPRYIWKPVYAIPEVQAHIIYAAGQYHLIDLGDSGTKINHQLALCLSTSGSTGSPKLVRLSQENIKSNAESIIEYLEISKEERPVTVLPMHYSYGMSILNSHLLQGANILLTEKSILQKEFWEFVKREKATSFSGVPYTYEMLRRLRFFKMELPFLKTLTQAGGKLNEKIVKEFAEFSLETGKNFFVMYGQTEASPRMSYLTTEEAVSRPSSIGKAVPGGTFHIEGPDGSKISTPYTEGELTYQGKNVCLGYAESKCDLDKGDDNHGILHTGDIAYFDEDGYYYISGRLKRFVKLWGNRCSLDAVEQIVRETAPECACLGEDNNVTIAITDESKINDIKELLSEKTGFHPSAFTIKLIGAIPKNSSGKILYEELKKALS